MTERRRFQVVPPDWGEAHLTPESVVAYVDREMAAGPHERATRHVGHCADCAAEVVAQRQARSALRGAGCPSLPSSLISSLRSIPQHAELPGPPAGLAVGADGEFVALAPEPPRPARRRRMRLGAGAAGLAIGALAFAVPASGSLPGAGGPAPSSATGGAPVANFAVAPPPTRLQPATRPTGPRTTVLNANLAPEDR